MGDPKADQKSRQTAGVAKIPVSVLISTRNEERLLPACLASVAWADEIVVFDSHSTDRTLEIARAAGAQVVQREFDSFARHKNWALANIPFRHRWVLLLDADERVTPELAADIGTAVARSATSVDGGPVGYYVARKLVFCGKWIRHGGVWPDYNLRLLQRGRGRYEDRRVPQHAILDGAADDSRENDSVASKLSRELSNWRQRRSSARPSRPNAPAQNHSEPARTIKARAHETLVARKSKLVQKPPTNPSASE